MKFFVLVEKILQEVRLLLLPRHDLLLVSRPHQQLKLGRNCNYACGGQVISVIAISSNDPSSNPAEPKSFFCKFCVKKNALFFCSVQ